MEKRIIKRIRAFTLVELVVVIGIVGLLMALLLPALGRVRGQARSVVCMSNLRNLGFAFAGYADDYDGYAMPARVRYKDIYTYWWGRPTPDGIDHEPGFIRPYLDSEPGLDSVYECPVQRFGSYGLQGKPSTEPDNPKWITSTYGYNGYYLCPPQSGWENNIGFRPWQKIVTVKGPDEVFAFADTLIEYHLLANKRILKNTFLLDPPYIYNPKRMGNPWPKNENPTTCFRHHDRVNVVFVDGHCGFMDLEGSEYVSPEAKIGSVGTENAPHYVPDWGQWPASEGSERRRRR